MDLGAATNNTYDADQDSMTYKYNWYMNDTSITVLNLPFDTNTTTNSSSAVRDYTPFENNGTLGGGNVSRVPSHVDGHTGGAYQFDGVDDFIDIGSDASIKPAGSFSISTWFNTDADFSSGSGVLLRYRTYGYNFKAASSNQITFSIANSTASNFQVASPSTYNDGVWHHAVGVYNVTHVMLYMDGSLVDTECLKQTPSCSWWTLRVV